MPRGSLMPQLGWGAAARALPPNPNPPFRHESQLRYENRVTIKFPKCIQQISFNFINLLRALPFIILFYLCRNVVVICSTNN